jgi:hypothetical protein
MAFTQFPSELAVRLIETDETAQLGGYKVATAMSLQNCVLSMYIHGALIGTEKFRLKIFPTNSATNTAAIWTSEYSELSDITSPGSYWLGNVKFTFSTRPNLNPNLTYYFFIQAADYTQTVSTYVSFVLDWPYPVYTQLTTGTPSAAMRLLGYT